MGVHGREKLGVPQAAAFGVDQATGFGDPRQKMGATDFHRRGDRGFPMHLHTRTAVVGWLPRGARSGRQQNRRATSERLVRVAIDRWRVERTDFGTGLPPADSAALSCYWNIGRFRV